MTKPARVSEELTAEFEAWRRRHPLGSADYPPEVAYLMRHAERMATIEGKLEQAVIEIATLKAAVAKKPMSGAFNGSTRKVLVWTLAGAVGALVLVVLWQMGVLSDVLDIIKNW